MVSGAYCLTGVDSQARNVQWCLARNGYNEKYCKAFIEVSSPRQGCNYIVSSLQVMNKCHSRAKEHEDYVDQSALDKSKRA